MEKSLKTFEAFMSEMVAGDSDGSPEKIASGETSGAVTSPGPVSMGKNKKEKDKK